MAKGKILKAGKIQLVDRWGRKIVELGASNGVPYVTRYDGKGRIVSWLTFDVNGTPDIRFFDDD